MPDHWSFRGPFGTVDLEVRPRAHADAAVRAESVRQVDLIAYAYRFLRRSLLQLGLEAHDGDRSQVW